MTAFTNETPNSASLENETKNSAALTNEKESTPPSVFDQAKFDTNKFDRGHAGEGTQFENETKH